MTQISTDLIDTRSGVNADGGSGALQLVARAFAWVAEQRRVNRTIAALSDLSDRTLADIGIERGNISRVARQRHAALNRRG